MKLRRDRRRPRKPEARSTRRRDAHRRIPAGRGDPTRRGLERRRRAERASTVSHAAHGADAKSSGTPCPGWWASGRAASVHAAGTERPRRPAAAARTEVDHDVDRGGRRVGRAEAPAAGERPAPAPRDRTTKPAKPSVGGADQGGRTGRAGSTAPATPRAASAAAPARTSRRSGRARGARRARRPRPGPCRRGAAPWPRRRPPGGRRRPGRGRSVPRGRSAQVSRAGRRAAGGGADRQQRVDLAVTQGTGAAAWLPSTA